MSRKKYDIPSTYLLLQRIYVFKNLRQSLSYFEFTISLGINCSFIFIESSTFEEEKHVFDTNTDFAAAAADDDDDDNIATRRETKKLSEFYAFTRTNR